MENYINIHMCISVKTIAFAYYYIQYSVYISKNTIYEIDNFFSIELIKDLENMAGNIIIYPILIFFLLLRRRL